MSSSDSLSGSSPRKGKAMKILGIILLLVMVGMTSLVLFLWMKNYEAMQKTQAVLERALTQQSAQYQEMAQTRKKLERDVKKSAAELSLETQQHVATKALLSQSNGLLVAAQAENDHLLKKITELEAIRDQQTEKSDKLEKKIAELKVKNQEVEAEIGQLNEKLAQYNTDINGLTEGRDVIRFFKEKIKEVKQGIHRIKRKAYLAKVEAQKERDRLEYLAGNNGFMMKDGEWSDPNPPVVDSSMVNIDVQFTK